MSDLTERLCAREPLIEAISTFLNYKHVGNPSDIRASLERTIDGGETGGVEMLGRRLADAGSDWNYYPPDPLARRIHHALADQVLRRRPVVSGAGQLKAIAGKPIVIVANHLSYVDANAVDVLLQGAGGKEVCDRLTVIAGPKVYSDVKRRFSSLCFGTIKVPQSGGLATGEAVMNAREAARAARRSIQAAHQRLALGEALLVFAEGSRSRTGQMQQLLAGVARYLEPPDVWVVPMALTGTERLFPIGEDALNPVPITLTIGQPMPASELRERARGDRQRMMDEVGAAIAKLLPTEYRGAYGESSDVRNQISD
jgi:1-acyl-sn-glycerol-3-phosphate acyltransferase